MSASGSLSVMMSRALVAFTVEFDNEFEHRMPHTTSAIGPAARSHAGPWLASQAMWVNALQYVSTDGIPTSELHRLARTTQINLPGLIRWGYVTVSTDADPLVALKKSGVRAVKVWAPLTKEIESRWEVRHGKVEIAALKQILGELIDVRGLALPRYLPITSPTTNGRAELPEPAWESDGDRDLSVLLAQALQLFQIDYESQSRLSLPIAANVLRVLTTKPIRLRDVPSRCGVSREAVDMALGFLERRACVVIGPDPDASRGQVVSLTERGERARLKYRSVLNATDRDWKRRYAEPVRALRMALGALTIEAPTPYPDGWRAAVRPLPLPDFPMVLHRGGYPDGS